MHKLQKTLLKRLIQQNNLRFGQLTSGYDFEDNILWHLNKLMENGLIAKNNGIYSLTLSGIKEITKYEPLELEEKGVKSFFIGFLCKDNDENYLIKSHSQAKVNFYNLPSGKPFFGEKIEDSLQRTFMQNTGLMLRPDRFSFVSLHLKTIKTIQEEILFDDAFTIYSVEIQANEKKLMSLMESINWKSPSEIQDLSPKWPEIDMCILNKGYSPYVAYEHVSNYIL